MKTSTRTNKLTIQDSKILAKAAEIIEKQFLRFDAFTSAKASIDYLTYKLIEKQSEVFPVLFLDSQNRLIEYREMFFGTINSSSVYPREVVKACIETNAAAVIFSHNHPSGDATPSLSDKVITKKLTSILEVIDVRVLDHIVVGKKSISFASQGLL